MSCGNIPPPPGVERQRRQAGRRQIVSPTCWWRRVCTPEGLPVQVGSRAAAETPIPTPSRPARARFCLLAGVRHARARGGESPPQRRLALEPAPASCLARPVPARLSQERTRTAGAGPCSPALARVLVLPAGSPSPLAPPPHPVPRGGSLYLRPRKSLGQPRPPRRNPRGCPRLTCGATLPTITFHVCPSPPLCMLLLPPSSPPPRST